MNSALETTVSNSDRPDTPHFSLGCSPEVAAAVHDLIRRGFSPLPVTPAFPASEYPSREDPSKPRFNGKNPSYIGSDGKPYEVKKWQQYADRTPTEAELQKYFSHPDIGIGCIGISIDGKRRKLDVDRKKFSSDSHFERATEYLMSKTTQLDKTPGGGCHLEVEFTDSDPIEALGQAQANVGLGDVDHAGEFQQFVVCPPTPGYQVIKAGPPLKVKSLEDIGLRFTAKTTKATTTEPPTPTPLPNPPRPVAPRDVILQLEPFVSKKIAPILSGKFGDDRSEDLVKLARELYGWQNLAKTEGIAIGSADSIVYSVAEVAGVSDKLERILKGINRDACEPALAFSQGIEACRERLLSAAGKAAKDAKKAKSKPQDIVLSSEDTPGLVAFRYLYENDDYVRIGDDFYKWVGTHFERQDERAEKKRISGLLKRCVRKLPSENDGSSSATFTRPFASAAKRNDAYQWCLSEVRFIQADEVNPPGVNLKNGVLIFEYGPEGPSPKLLEHSPEMVYTYAPQVAYHPEADDTHCRRLLEAIAPSYRSAVLRVFAAALDLEAVRKAKGRAVRGLLFSGSGANGKDALREAFTYIFGKSGITSCTIDDFHAYDQGRKFNLAPLVESRINWASENRMGVNIDDIQSLKQLITGDPLITEEKHQQGQEFTPRGIAIFSSNDRAINLTASLEAIATRYAIVPFTKTFKTNPKGPNELKADSRFKYDLEWVKAEVCPAMLNILIEEFQNIFAEGIDYSPFDAGMEENRVEANHLYRFSLDCGLVEDPDSWITNAELETKLRSWYIEEGILKVDADTGREKWEDDVRVGDPWVKGAQQYKRRFQKIFPNIDSYRTKSTKGIKGLKFVSPAELALQECKTWGEYCRAVDLHGGEAVKEAWGKLTLEQQNKIAAMRPDVTTPSPQEPTATEPGPQPEDEPLKDSEVESLTGVLLAAVEAQDLDILEDFKRLPKLHKQQVWDVLPDDKKEPVKVAMTEPRQFSIEDR